MKEPIVETTSGQVRGYVLDEVYGFRGIPYGSTTAGPNRWKAPSLPASWSGVRDAVEFGPWAPQPKIERPPDSPLVNFRDAPKSEDCLVLNIWTTGLRNSTPKPVIVSLHGGAFTLGSGDLAPETLVARGDVVVVSLNHRLGLLGHLYLAEIGGDEWADSGNAGVLDVVLALEWIRDNVAAFGGDPERVMTMGCSGGSSKTLALMGMPAAKGLFHRANPIDAPFMKACEPDTATAIAEETLNDLGVGPGELHRLYEMPWEQLLSAQNIDIAGELAAGSNRDRVLRYYPVVDGRALPAHPFHPAASDLASDVPMMTGSAQDSMTMLMLAQPWFGRLDEEGLHEIANRQVGRAGETVVAAYRRSHPEWTATEIACAIVTGRVMSAKTITLAERKAVGGTAPVYLYRWNYKAPGLGGIAGARHGGELAFVFKMIGKKTSVGFADVSPFEGDRPEDFEMQERVSEAWVRFAHEGDPNHPGLPKWPSYTPDDRPTMIFDEACRLEYDPEPEIRAAYEQVDDECWM